MSVRTPVPTGSETREGPGSEASAATSRPVQPRAELADFDRYVVSLDGPIGYVEVVSPVFVCYLGHPYAMAEEIAQVLDFERAVETVAERAAVSRRPKLAP
ncbi:hypothetical protein [Microbacterium sp. SA39]|uniref:hypothetical protein n=1 Tax=Microbacterium sp. SA39 TaxID=1263625 RepID=UPI0005FA64A2|nr:hypothetical protein [Microbacterium sp. SA39]KJQ52598.1 hypothetical protein RS85_03491 [Microbacterium sp. SA39]